MLTEVSKMAARNDAFVKPCFELLRKKSSYPLISEGRRICQLNLLTLAAKQGSFLLCKSIAKTRNVPFPRPCGATGNDAQKLHAPAFEHFRGAVLTHEVL